MNKQTFLTIFNILTAQNAVIDFNPKWENGTGYMDGVCVDPDLHDGLIEKQPVVATDPSGRRMVIFIDTDSNKPTAVFERYADPKNDLLIGQVMRGATVTGKPLYELESLQSQFEVIAAELIINNPELVAKEMAEEITQALQDAVAAKKPMNKWLKRGLWAGGLAALGGAIYLAVDRCMDAA